MSYVNTTTATVATTNTVTFCFCLTNLFFSDHSRLLASWRRLPGRPRSVWLNNVQKDADAIPLSTLWRSEITRGHRVAQRSTRDNDDFRSLMVSQTT